MYPNLMRVDRPSSQLRSPKYSEICLHSSSALGEGGGGALGDEGATGVGELLGPTRKQLVQSLPCDWLTYEEMFSLGIEIFSL